MTQQERLALHERILGAARIIERGRRTGCPQTRSAEDHLTYIEALASSHDEAVHELRNKLQELTSRGYTAAVEVAKLTQANGELRAQLVEQAAVHNDLVQTLRTTIADLQLSPKDRYERDHP